MLKITDEMVEVVAEAIQAWDATNSTLADVSPAVQGSRRRLARHILESFRDNFMFAVKPGSPC